MKKALLMVLTFTLAVTTLAFAKTKEIQFSIVLSADEAKTMSNKKLGYVSQKGGAPKELLVSKDVLLSRPDIQAMIIIKKADTKMKDLPFIDIVFTKDGTKKLEDVTTKNLRKSLAIIIGDQIFSAPYIIYPMSKGHIMVSHWTVDNDDAAANLVKELGFNPIFKGNIVKTLGQEQ